MPLEIATFSAHDAILVSTIADRIEACSSYELGGTTLALDELRTIRQHWTRHGITTPVHAMIRPSATTTFCASASTFERMEAEVVARTGLCDGFVFGILDARMRVDEGRCRRLVGLAAGLPCTFHRAVDCTADPVGALEALARCGFGAVLSAGGGGSAVEGLGVLTEMVATGTGVAVIAGGGVRRDNVGVVMGSGVQWVHSAAMVEGKLDLEEAIAIKAASDGGDVGA